MIFKITAREKEFILKRRLVLSEDTKKYRVALDILQEKFKKERAKKKATKDKLNKIKEIILQKKIEYGKAKIDNKKDQSKKLKDEIKKYTKRLRNLK